MLVSDVSAVSSEPIGPTTTTTRGMEPKHVVSCRKRAGNGRHRKRFLRGRSSTVRVGVVAGQAGLVNS